MACFILQPTATPRHTSMASYGHSCSHPVLMATLAGNRHPSNLGNEQERFNVSARYESVLTNCWFPSTPLPSFALNLLRLQPIHATRFTNGSLAAFFYTTSGGRLPGHHPPSEKRRVPGPDRCLFSSGKALRLLRPNCCVGSACEPCITVSRMCV